MKVRMSMTCLMLIFATAVFGQITEQEALESIRKSELKEHIYFLASDYMAGRVGPSHEYEIACQYVASQFAAAGVSPFKTLEDGTTTYFQEVPFEKETFEGEMKMNYQSGAGTGELCLDKDFKIIFGSDLENSDLEVVFAGYGIQEPDHKWNDLEGLDLEGKLVVVMMGAPMKKGKPVLPEEIHEVYAGERGLQRKMMPLFSKRPAALAFIGEEKEDSPFNFENLHSSFKTEKYTYQNPMGIRSSFSFPNIYALSAEAAYALFEGQEYHPKEAAENGIKGYKTFSLENCKIATEFPESKKEMVMLKNVIGVIPGTDPSLKDEYIVVGGHLDHVAPQNGEVCNGADDNASGSAGVIEVAEALAMNPPKRTVYVAAWTAEEMGLCGSNWFVNSGEMDMENCKFNINLDMIGRSDKDNEESRAHYAVTSKNFVDGIGDFVNAINAESINFPIIFDNDEDSPGGSDHMSFLQKDIPAFFFFSGVHEDLHKPGDDPEKVDYEKAEALSRLTYLIANKLANMSEIPDFHKEQE